MSIPEGCKTPKRDREEYSLTVSDFKFMIEHANKINDMLSYYINMPENGTGDLAIEFRNMNNYELLPTLCGKLDDIMTTLNNVYWR